MDNRTVLLDRALELLAARGYDAVGVQEIAAAAEVTKPTLYHYFGSKRGLLDTLLAERFAPLHTDLCTAAAYQGDLPLNLYQVAGVYFDFARENGQFYGLLMTVRHAPPHSEAYQAALHLERRQIAVLESLFTQALPHMEGRHHRYALTFLGMINVYITLAVGGDIALDHEVQHQAVHQFMYGVFS
ncbi:MAG: TetR/AcrR family transcriptional regulator [Chloroflexi bacterium]|nr:TetR/AcrR family transcriptional regulator [Chloroflexota bacterium]